MAHKGRTLTLLSTVLALGLMALSTDGLDVLLSIPCDAIMSKPLPYPIEHAGITFLCKDN